MGEARWDIPLSSPLPPSFPISHVVPSCERGGEGGRDGGMVRERERERKSTDGRIAIHLLYKQAQKTYIHTRSTAHTHEHTHKQ